MMRICGLLLTIAVFAGCSPKIEPTIEVPFVPVSVQKATLERGGVSIDEVKDMRPAPELVRMDEKTSLPASDIGGAVRSAMESSLQRGGITVSDGAALLLTVEVRKWIAKVSGGLPSAAEADAEFYVRLLDPANKVLYSGSYTGSAKTEQAGISVNEIRKVLGQAMSEALEQLQSDDQLIRIVSSF